ncbi:MAG: ferrous iron transport protein A [Actinobacteria bacterium]|nr:ferrous iron transport protein A [Actinomycetota bacterium]
MSEQSITPVRAHEQTKRLALADVAPGETAVIEEVTDPTGPVGRRLSDLGFLPGTEVLVVRRAPLRDPTIFQLRGNQMCLRKAEAKRILVSRPSSDSAPLPQSDRE